VQLNAHAQAWPDWCQSNAVANNFVGNSIALILSATALL
jgi:hypothetical protein